MDARGTFQSQIARIMDELAKAAVAEFSNLLQLELKHREEQKHKEKQKHTEEQIQNLLKRLRTAEGELQLLRATRASAASEKNSVSVQVEMSEDALEYGVSSSQFFEERPVQLLPHQEFRVLESDEDLEFEVKIEQVDEPKEEKCSQTESSRMAAEQDHFNSAYQTDLDSSQLYRTSVANSQNGNQQVFGEPDYSGGFEQHRKDFFAQAEQYAAAHMFIQDGNCSLPNVNLCCIVPAKDSGHGEELSESGEHVQAQHSKKQARATKQKPHKVSSVNKMKGQHAQPLSEPSEEHKQSPAGLKLYHCRECGKRFTQRNRLISHQWVHTGERPFRCRICAKMFSRQDNCQRHERLHSKQ